jgi:hypothetical protein
MVPRSRRRAASSGVQSDRRGLRNSGNYANRLRPDGSIAPRNDVVGLPLYRVAVSRLSPVPTGPASVEGSFEVFNLFNHANDGRTRPGRCLGVADQPRMVQLGFKLMF